MSLDLDYEFYKFNFLLLLNFFLTFTVTVISGLLELFNRLSSMCAALCVGANTGLT